MTLNGRLAVDLSIDNITGVDLGSISDPLRYAFQQVFADGSGAGQVNKIFKDTRSINASSSESLDLAGGVTDSLGASITFAKVRLLLVRARSTNVNNVQVGGAASNALVTWVADATDIVNVRPGGALILMTPDATAYTVTASTGDLLKIANSGSGSAVVYDIVILGS